MDLDPDSDPDPAIFLIDLQDANIDLQDANTDFQDANKRLIFFLIVPLITV
jgi:hypothetical protein